MENESFLNKPENVQEGEMPQMDKQKGQDKLFELFGIRTTEEFQANLQQGDFELAQKWLNFIEDNQKSFLEFQANWYNWSNDRKAEIEFYRNLAAEGKLAEIEFRTKEEARQDLQQKFGFCDTGGFQATLQRGDIEKAKQWFAYIQKNKLLFPQYIGPWDRWVAHREKEIAEAEKTGEAAV